MAFPIRVHFGILALNVLYGGWYGGMSSSEKWQMLTTRTFVLLL